MSVAFQEVVKHNNKDDFWIILHDNVYDLTSFLKEHPGGANVLLKNAGNDGTKHFQSIHSKSLLSTLSKDQFIGKIDKSTIPSENVVYDPAASKIVVPKPKIETILNIYDIESVASKVMKKEGFDYYASASDDEITSRENHLAFQRIWLKPRVLVDVSRVSTRTKIFGFESALPLYVTATALGKLAHPDGETAITRACYNKGLIQMIPTWASCSLDEIVEAKQPNQVQFYQLYVNVDRKKTEELVRRVEELGCKALFVTVDAPGLGNRERDRRNKFKSEAPKLQKGEKIKRNEGVANAISSFMDSSLCWADLAWLKSLTSLPIILKGIQCGEDAVKAAEHGCAGIVISNHGGRTLDFGRSAIEILPEVMEYLDRFGFKEKLEVVIDGGVRRGSDIFKALALGATAVGIGRPSIYGLAAYGQDGVEKVFDIFQYELKTVMQNCGTPSIKDINSQYVCTKNLSLRGTGGIPIDHLQQNSYIPLNTSMQHFTRSKL